MMKVYDMVTCSLYAPEPLAGDDTPISAPRADSANALELGLQQHETARERRPELHPALQGTDVEAFLAAFDR